MKGSRASGAGFRRVGIVAKTASSPAVRLARALERALVRRGRTVLFDEWTAAALRKPHGSSRGRISREADLVLVLGGDGTLLSVARLAPSRTPLLGINVGLLGFLAGLAQDEAIRRLDDVLAGRFREDRRRRLDVVVPRGPHHGTYRVLNDAVLNREALARISTFSIALDGRTVSEFRADGVVVSTPDRLHGLQPVRRRPDPASGARRDRRHADLPAHALPAAPRRPGVDRDPGPRRRPRAPRRRRLPDPRRPGGLPDPRRHPRRRPLERVGGHAPPAARQRSLRSARRQAVLGRLTPPMPGEDASREKAPQKAQRLSATRLLLVVVLFFALAAYSIWNSDRFQTLLQGVSQARLSALLERKVEFRRVSFRVFPPSVQLADVRIANDPRLGGEPFLSAEELTIGGGLSIGRRRAALRRVRAVAPRLSLVQFADGTWNLPPGLTSRRQGRRRGEVRFGELVIQQGVFELEGRRWASTRRWRLRVQIASRPNDRLPRRPRMPPRHPEAADAEPLVFRST
jgi:hypothetical protein